MNETMIEHIRPAFRFSLMANGLNALNPQDFCEIFGDSGERLWDKFVKLGRNAGAFLVGLDPSDQEKIHSRLHQEALKSLELLL